MKLWHIAALVMSGVVLGLFHLAPMQEIFRFATLSVFLPAIIFEAAWHLDARTMLRAWRPILLLTVPGVAITAAVITVSVQWLGGVAFGTALIIGVVLCATDPVAVVAIFRRLRVPHQLAMIVESESLLNDAIAVALFQIAIGASVGFGAVTGIFGAVVLGVAVGAVAAFALRSSVPMWVQTFATVVCAYGVYAIADRLHLSGIFAVIAAAMTMRELERRLGSVEAAHGVERAWHVLATVANAILFLLIGDAVSPHDLWSQRYVLIATVVGVIVARVILAYGLLALVPKMLASWRTVVRLAGVRGALSLALVLSVSNSLPQRELAIDATFVVVVASIVIGTLTYERRIAGLVLEVEEEGA